MSIMLKKAFILLINPTRLYIFLIISTFEVGSFARNIKLFDFKITEHSAIHG